MEPFLLLAQRRLDHTINLIRALVHCESAESVVALLEDSSQQQAQAHRFPSVRGADHLLLEFNLPFSSGERRILGLGHSDTVWPAGTLRQMPFRQEQGRLWGPGVLDMKSGLAFWMEAVAILKELNLRPRRPLALLVVSDEEVGSPTSRARTETEARASGLVLVLEPGTGLTGKLKTERKGVGRYRLTIEGVAAHAGVDFQNGASAIVEMSQQVVRIADLTDLQRGLTLNPGTVTGGSATNVIAARAEADIDVRVRTLADAQWIDARLRGLAPVDSRCRLSWSGGLNRPPMERTPEIAALFAQAQKIGSELGLSLEESATGGGSDGSFTAAIGIPTLDGLGGVGEGAHATDESILVDKIPERVALLAALLCHL